MAASHMAPVLSQPDIAWFVSLMTPLQWLDCCVVVLLASSTLSDAFEIEPKAMSSDGAGYLVMPSSTSGNGSYFSKERDSLS